MTSTFSWMILKFWDSSIQPSGPQIQSRLATYSGDGARFQKFAFDDIGEIDFIVAGPLTATPYEVRGVEGRPVKLKIIPEIISKKIYYRGSEAIPRDIFDLAAAAKTQREPLVVALSAFPKPVAATLDHLHRLNPEFVEPTIRQLMILPDYISLISESLSLAKDALD